MAGVVMARMSSKGQVVIPEEVRNRLGLKAGSQFIVVGEGDTVILKAISAPSVAEYDDLLTQGNRGHKFISFSNFHD